MKLGGLGVKFVQVCDWFDGCDRLKLYLNHKKKDYQIVLYFKNN